MILRRSRTDFVTCFRHSVAERLSDYTLARMHGYVRGDIANAWLEWTCLAIDGCMNYAASALHGVTLLSYVEGIETRAMSSKSLSLTILRLLCWSIRYNCCSVSSACTLMPS